MTRLVDIYEVDKRAAQICSQMTIDGFAFDSTRAAEFSAILKYDEDRTRSICSKTADIIDFNPRSPKQMHQAFFQNLHAPVMFRSSITKKPSLGVDALRAYAASSNEQLRELSIAVLEFRRASKIRGTYIEGVKVGSDGRVHCTWQNFGTVSGRWSAKQPNLQNLPRPANDPTSHFGGIRSLYFAPDGKVLVAGDMKQLEMRIAAYVSGDPTMIAACESADLHCANAAVIFPEAFVEETYNLLKSKVKAKVQLSTEESNLFAQLENLRTLAKTAGFAVCYMAQATTVYASLLAAGVNVRLRAVEKMLQQLKKAFDQYYSWQNRQLLQVMQSGYTYTPMLGRRRWLGHEPSPTECANFPIQGGAADLMNFRLPVLVERAKKLHRAIILVAQVHDSAVFECPVDLQDKLARLMHEVFEEPIVISTSGSPLSASFPIDIKISQRWN